MKHAVLALALASLFVIAQLASARGLRPQKGLESGRANIRTKDDFRAAGGSLKALGRDMLRRVKHNSGWEGTVDELATKLDSDEDLAVDISGNYLFHDCHGLASLSPDSSSAADALVEAAAALAPGAADPTLTLQQVLTLHSRPSATKKLLLDFDGHVATNTQWNSAYGLPTITVQPYDTDGNPASFSTSELSDIVAIWRAVSEDYAAFDVDVTTEDQAGGAVAYTNMMRAGIGGSWSDWSGSSSGGIANVNSFGSADGSPCFVFAKNLVYVKKIWEATSHELGHTLGLFHDGTIGGSAYYTGQGDWAPIMGFAYDKQVTQFDKGEYTNSNNAEQDDFAVMSRFLPLLTQANGKDTSTATPMTLTSAAGATTTTFSASGLICQQDVPEVFTFALPAAPAGAASNTAACSFTVTVVAPWSSFNRANLNAALTIRDASGAVVTTIDPSGASPSNGLGIAAASATLQVSAAGGSSASYFVSVAGTGSGDPLAGGYSSYGSRGQYDVAVSCASAATLAPPPPPSPSPSPSPSPPPVSNPTPDQPAAVSYSLTKSGKACSVTVTVTVSTTGAAVNSAIVQGSWFAPSGTYPTASSSFAGATSAGQFKTNTAKLSSSPYSCRVVISTVKLPAGYFAASGTSLTFDKTLTW